MLLLLSFLPLTLLYQVFNNYGAKANEELIMGYGFALHENVHDVFGLSLAFSTRAAAPPHPPRRGRSPFRAPGPPLTFPGPSCCPCKRNS